jgi:hypothetical protein
VFAKQPVQARDADVVQPIDGVTHESRGDGGFFGDGEVRRSGGGDEDRAPTLWRGAQIQGDTPRQLVELRVGELLRYNSMSFARRSRHE